MLGGTKGSVQLTTSAMTDLQVDGHYIIFAYSQDKQRVSPFVGGTAGVFIILDGKVYTWAKSGQFPQLWSDSVDQFYAEIAQALNFDTP